MKLTLEHCLAGAAIGAATIIGAHKGYKALQTEPPKYERVVVVPGIRDSSGRILGEYTIKRRVSPLSPLQAIPGKVIPDLNNEATIQP